MSRICGSVPRSRGAPCCEEVKIALLGVRPSSLDASLKGDHSVSLTPYSKSHQLQIMQQTVIVRRVVRLSFDDGPNPTTTPPLLDHLRDHGVKATFFVLGQNIVHQEGRAILERIACDGHQIGNHSYSHPDLTKLTAKQIEDEIKRTEALIGSLDNGMKLFRPPFGFHNSTVDGSKVPGI